MSAWKTRFNKFSNFISKSEDRSSCYCLVKIFTAEYKPSLVRKGFALAMCVGNNPASLDRSKYHLTFITLKKGNQRNWIIITHPELTEYIASLRMFSLSVELSSCTSSGSNPPSHLVRWPLAHWATPAFTELYRNKI